MTKLLLAAAAQQEGTAAITFPVVDTFGRTEATGLGSPDQGPAWTVNDASFFSVSGGKGNMPCVASRFHRALQSSHSRLVVDQSAQFTFSALADVTQFTSIGIYARYIDNNNWYGGFVLPKAGGQVDTWVRKRVAGVNTDYDYQWQQITGLAASDTLSVRFDVTGDGSSAVMNLYVNANAAATTLRSTYTDSTSVHGAGAFGFELFTAAGVTNNPTYSIDNYSAS